MNELMEVFNDLSWAEMILILFAVAEAIVNITPSEKDNSVLLKVKKLFSFIFPNIRKGGGKHE